jgi:hypothetical protein
MLYPISLLILYQCCTSEQNGFKNINIISSFIFLKGCSCCTLGGFNVSNLMGIKRRMIDIGKKITFYFLQNVWNCTDFFAFAFKVCKKCYYDPKHFFLEKYQCGYRKNAEFYADFKFVDANLNKCPLKKLEQKNHANLEYFRFCAYFRGFLLLTFVRGISESLHQWIWNQHKILRFFDTQIDIFHEKIFLAHNRTFCIP